MPKVSVVMPVYNGAKHIKEAIDSVLTQTFVDWDFWVINEYGSDDGSAEIVAEYARQDSRFHLVQNKERLGLAESLNLGFRLSGGEYIARLDADDLAHLERFAKQVELLDNRPEVGICGTWQHHFGKYTDWIHKPQASAGNCRARLLFNCDLCHSTLMLRRSTVFAHNLFYDNSFYAEDYELWCRAIMVTDIVNIPEVLGEYRVGEDNITAGKKELLDVESGRLVARNLEQSLGLHLTEDECELFRGWRNPFADCSGAERQNKLDSLEQVLRRIYEANQKKHFFAEAALLSVLAAKWRWAKYDSPWDSFDEIGELNQIFDENYKPSVRLRYKNFCAHNKTLGAKTRKVCVVMLRPVFRPFRKRIEGLLNNLERNICDFVEAKTWDRYLRLSGELKKEYADLCEQKQLEIDRLNKQLSEMEENIVSLTNSRIWQAEKIITKTVDGRIWQAEQGITQTVDGRIWKAEQNINQATDGRIWKAEENINQITDGRIWQAEQSINQTTDSRIWQAEKEIKHIQRRLVNQIDNLEHSEEPKKIFLIGTPEHSNIGDAAIALGEMKFIRKFFPKHKLVELAADDFTEWYESTASKIRQDDLIFLQGGGNLGNKYLNEENIRRQVIRDFPDNQIVILPQTVFFDETEAGRRELAVSADIYNRHMNLLMMVRGNRSLEFVRAAFPNAAGICVPDMALQIDAEFSQTRKGILLCVRDLYDESGLLADEYAQILNVAKELDPEAEISKNIYQDDYESKIYSDIRHSVVMRELRKFASHKVVVTDRLHGLIFAVLTHTPCVVLSAYNYKIAEFYQTFIKSATVFFIDKKLEELADTIVKAMNTKPADEAAFDDALFAKAHQMITERMVHGEGME